MARAFFYPECARIADADSRLSREAVLATILPIDVAIRSVARRRCDARAASSNPGRLMTPQDLTAVPSDRQTGALPMERTPNQFAELRVPNGAGLHPWSSSSRGCFRPTLR